jgi:hypothetical protein
MLLQCCGDAESADPFGLLLYRYFGPPKPKPKRGGVGPGGKLPTLAGRPGSAPATAPGDGGGGGGGAAAGGDVPSEEKERVEKMLGALYAALTATPRAPSLRLRCCDTTPIVCRSHLVLSSRRAGVLARAIG